jgi:4-diphosphocytidyl-2-C-methyl-D-erythritol kinase
MNFKVYKSPAKVNLFLKMTGEIEVFDNKYFELFSRFLKVETLFDELTFRKKNSFSSNFNIIGNFDFPTEKNIIFKTYQNLIIFLEQNKNIKKSQEIKKFFENYDVLVEKNIPQMAGLGGGSSNSAIFLNAINEIFELNLNILSKHKIIDSLGSDIAFFLYENTQSANVFGRGEIIKPFSEKLPKIEIFTPKNINCNTVTVYKKLRENFVLNNLLELKHLESLKSKELFLDLQKDPYFANDLFKPAIKSCPKLKDIAKELIQDNYLFSGSGSSFFKLS